MYLFIIFTFNDKTINESYGIPICKNNINTMAVTENDLITEIFAPKQPNIGTLTKFLDNFLKYYQ